MLKRALSISAICAIFCGVSFAKSYSALDIAEKSLQGAKEAGIEYSCQGDNSYALCHFQDIDTFAMQLKNVKFEFFLSDSTSKQTISGDINTYLNQDIEKFIPKRFACTSESSLMYSQTFGKDACVLESPVATIKLDVNAETYSKAYRYKTMPTIIVATLGVIQNFADRFDTLDSEYYQKISDLRKQRNKNLEIIEAEHEVLQESLKKLINEEQDACICKAQEMQAFKQDKQQRQQKLARNEAKKIEVKENYEREYDRLQKEYAEQVETAYTDIIAWLKQYNYHVTDMRLHVQTRKLAENTFGLFAKDLFEFDYQSATPQQKLEYEEEKKRVYAEYYSGLETAHVVANMLIKQNLYLQDHLKKSLTKVVSDHAKLFDPNSHKRSVKIIIQPRDGYVFNLGDEAEKFRNAYLQSSKDKDAFEKFFIDILNRYDIRSVRYWPNY